MNARRRRHFKLKYCYQKRKLIVKSESIYFRKAIDFLLGPKTFMFDALRRGYDILLATNFPPHSFNMGADNSSAADFLDASSSAGFQNEWSNAHDSMSHIDSGFLSDDLFDDSPARGMWDVTSIYYSSMHMDD